VAQKPLDARCSSNVYWTVHHCNTCASACKMTTTQNQPHQISNTQRTENKTTDVVTQQHSRKLLKMDILMSETCWAHKKWNKITRDIKLVFHSSTRCSYFASTTRWLLHHSVYTEFGIFAVGDLFGVNFGTAAYLYVLF